MDKRKHNFKFSLCLMVLVINLILVSCGSKKEDLEEDSKALRIALSMDPGFDMIDNLDSSSKTLIQAHAMIYEGLVSYGHKGEIQPCLAKSWEISPDGKTYTFSLRDDVSFSDGSKFNADAVEFSFKRWVDDPVHQSIDIARLLDSIKVLDDYTIEFTFKEEYYPLLTEFTYPRPVRIMSPNSVEPSGDINGKFINPIGTGKWIVDEYMKDREASLISNPNYWGVKPELEKIVFKVIPDSQTRILAMKNGEIDLQGDALSSLSIDSLHSIRDSENIDLITGDSTTSYIGIMNYENPLLQDINIRRAMNLALDKDVLVQDLMDGLGKPAKALFQAGVPYTSEENSSWYGYQPDKARELLSESGYSEKNKDGYLVKNGEVLSFNLVFSNREYSEWKLIAEYLQDAFKKIGIKLNLQNMEVNAYYDALWQDKNYDLIIYRTYSDSWNPHGFLSGIFKNTSESKAVGWSNETLDKLIDEAIFSKEDTRQDRYDDLYEFMYDQAIFIPLYYPDSLYLINSKLSNVEFGPDSYNPFIWENIKFN